MKLKSLRTLIALHENNCDFSVHKALAIPRSTMWSHITEIEGELNVKLIHRRKKNSTFTDEGISFIPHAKNLYEIYLKSVDAVTTEALHKPATDILISTTQAVADSWLLPSTKLFYENSQETHIKVVASDTLTKQLINSADFFLRPIDDLEGISKIWHVGYHHGLFASKEYLGRMGVPQTPDDLLTHHVLGYGQYEFSNFGEINWHISGKYGIPKLNPSMTINSTKALYKAACEGLGICSSPVESNDIYQYALQRILPDIQGPYVESFFSIRDDINDHKKNSIASFQKFIEDYLKNQGVIINYA